MGSGSSFWWLTCVFVHLKTREGLALLSKEKNQECWTGYIPGDFPTRANSSQLFGLVGRSDPFLEICVRVPGGRWNFLEADLSVSNTVSKQIYIVGLVKFLMGSVQCWGRLCKRAVKWVTLKTSSPSIADFFILFPTNLFAFFEGWNHKRQLSSVRSLWISFLQVNGGCKVYNWPRFMDTSWWMSFFRLFQLLNNFPSLPDAPQTS